MNVLSLFDGCSGGQQALDRLGMKVDNYYASEIDKYAIQVTMANYPNTIQLGSVVDVDVSKLPKIDLLCGGSPCQSFSFAGKRKGMSTKDNIEILTLEHYLELRSQNFEFEGQSYLFWEYMRILSDIKKVNPNVKFLLENVMMGEKWQRILTQAIGINPIEINSALISAQNRRRLYWTNIGVIKHGFFDDLKCAIKQPKDKGILLKDVLQSEIDEKYYLSEKIIEGFERHKKRHNNKGTGFAYSPKNENDKGNSLRANAALCPTDNMLIVKNNTVDIQLKKTNVQIQKTIKKNDFFENEIKGIDFYNQSKHDKMPTLANPSHGHLGVFCNTRIRRLTPIEWERLQTVKDNYTAHVSDSQRYKMLGNGWTIDVIAHIFSFINK